MDTRFHQTVDSPALGCDVNKKKINESTSEMKLRYSFH